MIKSLRVLGLLAAVTLEVGFPCPDALACCPAPHLGKPVVNADQTVILIWDPATKTEHFIRQASFKSSGNDFGFLIPSPSKPELSESGNEAFPYLRKLTEPEVQKVSRPAPNIGCGCGGVMAPQMAGKNDGVVHVLEEKQVAGFHASVLEADSTDALVGWLKEHDYAFSPEVAAWAKPYVEGHWKITALKVAKDDKEKTPATKDVAAAALRMSFKTERPLFPYREPDFKSAADELGAKQRLLRIYLLSDARYRGELTQETPWTGKTAWANRLKPEDRRRVLELLQLPPETGPAEWWLTEFEDEWPYKVAPADVYFSRNPTQDIVKREPIIQYVRASPWQADVTAYAVVAVLLVPPVVSRVRRRRLDA